MYNNENVQEEAGDHYDSQMSFNKNPLSAIVKTNSSMSYELGEAHRRLFTPPDNNTMRRQ
jgi:hypothetical protein